MVQLILAPPLPPPLLTPEEIDLNNIQENMKVNYER